MGGDCRGYFSLITGCDLVQSRQHEARDPTLRMVRILAPRRWLLVEILPNLIGCYGENPLYYMLDGLCFVVSSFRVYFAHVCLQHPWLATSAHDIVSVGEGYIPTPARALNEPPSSTLAPPSLSALTLPPSSPLLNLALRSHGSSGEHNTMVRQRALNVASLCRTLSDRAGLLS